MQSLVALKGGRPSLLFNAELGGFNSQKTANSSRDFCLDVFTRVLCLEISCLLRSTFAIKSQRKGTDAPKPLKSAEKCYPESDAGLVKAVP